MEFHRTDHSCYQDRSHNRLTRAEPGRRDIHAVEFQFRKIVVGEILLAAWNYTEPTNLAAEIVVTIDWQELSLVGAISMRFNFNFAESVFSLFGEYRAIDPG